MNRLLLCSLLATAAASTAADAAPTINFAGGSGTLPAGTTVIQDFEGYTPYSMIGTNTRAYPTSVDSGARPAFGSTGNFGAVLNGGDYSLTFAPTSMLAFVLGSLDTYNTLTLGFADGSSKTYNGGEIVNQSGLPWGNQSSAQTNGVVSYSTGSGPKIVGAHFKSSGIAFEFDNISTMATAAPEPATWAMMIAGFGLVGFAMRRRPTSVSYATA